MVVVDPAPLAPWPNNYGVWVDEFDAMGLGDCLEVVWPQANVFLDSGPKDEKCAAGAHLAWFFWQRVMQKSLGYCLQEAAASWGKNACHEHTENTWIGMCMGGA